MKPSLASVAAVVAASALGAIAAPTCRNFKSVMYIILENENYIDVMQDPYMGTTLPPQGYLLTGMHGVTHPSQPNYIAMVAGSFFGIDTDLNVDLAQPNIADSLEAQGLTWKGYAENFPGGCYTADGADGGVYRRKHVPFLSFTSITQNATRCANIVNADQLNQDAANGNLANYMFFTPNMINDGHNSDIPTASAWLQNFLDPKLKDPAYANTLFFVTFDEDKQRAPGNAIYGILLGAGIKGQGLRDDAQYDHFSMLATVQNAFGLASFGLSDAQATAIPLAC